MDLIASCPKTIPSLDELHTPSRDSAGVAHRPEESIHQWLQHSLKRYISPGEVVIGVGGADTRLLAPLMRLRCRVIGSDPSIDRLQALATLMPASVCNLGDLRVEQLFRHDSSSSLLLIQSSVAEISSHVSQANLRCHALLANCTHSLSTSAEALFQSLHSCVLPNGVILFAGNVLVREGDFEWGSLARAIRNRGALPHQQLVNPDSFFEYLVHTPDGPIRRRDTARDLGSLARIIESGAWLLEEVQAHPADGCLHVEALPDSQIDAHHFVSPDPTVSLIKLGLVLRKRVLNKA